MDIYFLVSLKNTFCDEVKNAYTKKNKLSFYMTKHKQKYVIKVKAVKNNMFERKI